MKEVAERLDAFVLSGWNLSDSDDYEGWLRQLLSFMKVAMGVEAAEALAELGGRTPAVSWREYRDRQLGHLEGLALTLARGSTALLSNPQGGLPKPTETTPDARTVFVVHGHDVSAKESVARFLEKMQLVPVILHEQANEGRTVIEKFEAHANVGYAVVLLTPDDVGASAVSPKELRGRARQNVILELGYFTGRLGRRRVCGLYKPGVEIPSDFHGVLFIEIDTQGGWRTKLAQELVGAGMKIDLQGLLHS